MGMLPRQNENDDTSTSTASTVTLREKENIDPFTLKYSPLRKPGSVARKALGEITQEHMKKKMMKQQPSEESAVEKSNDDVVGLFENLNDSPLRMKNFRE